MDSAQFIEEEFRLATGQSRLPVDVRRDAAMGFAMLSDHRARLEAAERRFDEGGDLDGLDEALRVFEDMAATRAWHACAADRRADLGRRVSRVYHKRYENAGDERDLRAAIDTSEAAVDAAAQAMAAIGTLEDAAAALEERVAYRAGPEQSEAAWSAMAGQVPAAYAEMRAMIASCEPTALAALGEDLTAAFDREADRELIDRAVAALEEARAARERSGLAPSSREALHLGAARLLRFKSYGALEDADASVAATREAVGAAEDAGARAHALDGLGCCLLARSELQPGGTDLTAAIACFEEAAALVPAFAWFRGNLATALSARFQRDGDRADATRAVELLDAALAEVPRAAPDRVRLEQNAVAVRSALDGSQGAASARALLDVTPAGARLQPARLGGLAKVLLAEAERTLSVEQLDEALDTYRRALDAASPGAVDRPSLLHGLGQALSVRFALLGADEDLDAALETLRDAVAAAGRGGPELPDFKVSLGMAASMRATRTASRDDRRSASAHFAEASAAGQELSAHAALRAARAWGQWAAEEGDWPEAAEAGRLAVVAADRVHRVQVGRTDREASLAGAGVFHGDAAIALLRAGKNDEALVTIERGRAQLVSETLERERAELGALPPELSEAYTAAAAQVVAAERSTGGTSSREAHDALQEVVAKVQRVPGHEGFLRPMTFEGVSRAARETPLVYVGSSMLGAAVVAALPGGRVVTRIVEGVDDYVVAERVDQLQSAQASRTADPRGWTQALDDAGRWMGATVWAAVRDVLGAASRAVVVQAGLMTLLPLQIAWSEDGATPSGRRYAIDDVELTFAPNARSLESCRRLATTTDATSVLTVGAPEHAGMSRLEHGARESAAVRSAFGAGESLPGPAATRDAVLKALSRHGVLHFACHGRARPDAPLESALLLAGDDALTVRDLLAQQLPGARLAVLSACETSAVGTRLVDEVVGLPTAFLQAGVAGVIATSWEVEDDSAALLVRRFFDEWSGGSPAAALRAAQRWVRDSSNGDKLAAYADLAQQPESDLEAEDLEDWRTGLDHVDIQHWGGFIHAGA